MGAAMAASPTLDVKEIVAQSVANNQANWKAAPDFGFTDREIAVKGDEKTVRTYRVRMIDGSPYNELIAIDGKALTGADQQREQQKLQRETDRRTHEGAWARNRRIAEYERQRKQDQLLMQEMIDGFNFKLAGTEIANGRECYRIEATPNPNYVPHSREAQVLKGMKGTLWIDAKALQWVRVEAAVFKPVSFGLFIAHVEPGTEFVLEQAPVEGNVWQPTYFETRVNATIFFWPHKTLDQNYYSDYQLKVEKASR